MQRILLFTIPMLIAISLFVGLSYYESADDQSDSENNTAKLDFDAYSEGINSVLFDESGNIEYTLTARRQTHFNNDVTEFEEPLLRLYREDSSSWNIVANSGKISDKTTSNELPSAQTTQIINLTGDVEVRSLDDLGNRTLITTDSLLVDPNEETLQTEETVQMFTENLEQSATGMFADMSTDEITLKQDIHGIYEPPTQ